MAALETYLLFIFFPTWITTVQCLLNCFNFCKLWQTREWSVWANLKTLQKYDLALKNTESPFSGRSLNACGVNESAHELILYLHFHQLIEPSGTNVLWHFTVYHIYERNDHCRSALANAMYGSSSCQWNTMTPTLWRIYCGKLWRAQLKRRWMFIFFLNGQVFFVSHSVTFHTS